MNAPVAVLGQDNGGVAVEQGLGQVAVGFEFGDIGEENNIFRLAPLRQRVDDPAFSFHLEDAAVLCSDFERVYANQP